MTGTLTLARGGSVIKRVPIEEHELKANVPPGAATYTLTADAHNSPRYLALSSRVTAQWRFRSARTGGQTMLPLRAVRYAPAGLDLNNRARAGTVTRIPIWVERNPGSASAKIKTMAVEASFDDGKTWRRTTLKTTGQGWTTDLKNPAKGFVSLRAAVTDTAGNAVTQTILRAYAIG